MENLGSNEIRLKRMNAYAKVFNATRETRRLVIKQESEKENKLNVGQEGPCMSWT